MNAGRFPPVVLIGKRIRLRLIEERDAPQLFELYSDQEVMRYWNHAPWTTLDQADRAIHEARSEHASGVSLHYVIEQLSTKKVIGSCALYSFTQENRRAALGYLLCQSCWGQGYLSEAMRIFIDYAFAELELESIYADVNPDNVASAKALNRLGFQHDRYRRESWIVAGEKCDTDSYGIDRYRWLKYAAGPGEFMKRSNPS